MCASVHFTYLPPHILRKQRERQEEAAQALLEERLQAHESRVLKQRRADLHDCLMPVAPPSKSHLSVLKRKGALSCRPLIFAQPKERADPVRVLIFAREYLQSVYTLCAHRLTQKR
eukprot:GEMP01066487.1.p1 GENE.GEMP01066487.1~~GEMP01066487.1.p1  ORF type:complete len:116 (+),score=29.92 GEMP01066487.1:108-455(+)